jgi:hypothetical protein
MQMHVVYIFQDILSLWPAIYLKLPHVGTDQFKLEISLLVTIIY